MSFLREVARLYRVVSVSAAIGAALLALCASAVAQPPPTPHPNQFGLNLIQAPVAWGRGYSGAGIAAAIADTGIDVAHPAFAGKIDPRSMNFRLPNAGDPYVAGQVNDLDNGGHGTHGAGIMGAAGTSNAPGVAYNANLVVLRIIGGVEAPQFPSGSTAALNYFAGLPQNVMVYNASYGPDFSQSNNLQSWPATSIDPDEAAAVRAALAAGKIVVGASGNDREPNPVAGRNPSGIPLYPFIQPGHANTGVYVDGGNNYDFSDLRSQPGAIVSVTAVGQNKTIASYAQLCGVTASWCVAAPGGNQPNDPGIWSTLPPSTYGYQQGTSMAAPMVSGALALLQQAYPTYNAQDLTRLLFATAENVGGQAAVNATYGYGLIRLDRATDGPTTLAAGASVNVASLQMNYWSQPLTTGGAFSKIGDGYLIIAGRTSATGAVTVNAGALGVNGTLTLGNGLTIAQGGTLTGFGVVVGNTTIHGTLGAGQLPNYSDLIANNGGTLPAGIPTTGTSAGTLTFQGNVTLSSTATHRVNVDGNLQLPGGPGTFDKIVVAGNGVVYTANGMLVPVLRGIPGGNNNYMPVLGAQFPFVLAQGGASVAGQYAGLTQPAAGLGPNTRFDVRYSATAITLNVTPLSFATVAAAQTTNPNLLAVARAIDGTRPAAGTRGDSAGENELFSDLYGTDAEGDEAAFAALSGQGMAALPGAIMNAFAAFSDVIADRQATALAGGAGVHGALSPSVAFAYAARLDAEARMVDTPFADPKSAMASSSIVGKVPRQPLEPQWLTWGQSFGRWSKVSTTDELPGYNSRGGGFVFGADRTFAPNLIAGGAFGYSRTTINSIDVRATTNSYAGALYATWMPGAFVFDGRFVVGPAATGTRRTIVFPGESEVSNANINGVGALLAGEAGYRFQIAGTTFKPFVGLTGQAYKQSQFTEMSDLGLEFPAQTFSKVSTTAGLWWTSTYKIDSVSLMPQVKLAWRHDLRNETLTTRAVLFDEPFDIDAASPRRDAAVVGVNVLAWQMQSLRVFGGYSGEIMRNAATHQVSGGLRAIW